MMTCLRRSIRAGCATALLAGITCAVAAPATTPGLQLSDTSVALRVVSEEVSLSFTRITTTYVVQSTLAEPRTVLLGFSTPPVRVDQAGGNEIDDQEDDPQGRSVRGLDADQRPIDFLGLRVRVNDKPLPLNGRGHAWLGSRDITRDLRALGIALVFAAEDELRLHSVREPLKSRLDGQGFSADGVAQWTYQVEYRWAVSIPPGRTRIVVSHAPAKDMWPADWRRSGARGSLDVLVKKYCLDEETRAALEARPGAFNAFALTHHWSVDPAVVRPIDHARLHIAVKDGVNAQFCPAQPRQVDADALEWRATDFTPLAPMPILLLYRGGT